MRILSIGGYQKGVGKTTLAAFLLKNFPAFGALKVTVCEGVCPRPDPCGVCERLTEPYALVTDEAVLSTSGTDTARLLAAGAKKVVWLQATGAGLKEGIAAALELFSDLAGIITEGNHFISSYQPDKSLLVMSVGFKEPKPSAEDIFDKVDMMVVNHRGVEESHQFLAMQNELPASLIGKPIYLVEPHKSESIDNEIFLTYLRSS